MTALSQYQRLEAVALWRTSQDEQRREVILSLGDATLTISDIHGKALSHWSIAAMVRTNSGRLPAIFHPDGDPAETIELASTELDMIDALEKILRALDRRKAHPGKLRTVLTACFFGSLALAGFIWLPSAITTYTVNAVPEAKRHEIGEQLLSRTTRITGQPCDDPAGLTALKALDTRILSPETRHSVIILPSSVLNSAHLPGGIFLLGHSVVEDFEDPDVPAGYLLVEALRAQQHDPLYDLLRDAGLWATLKLFATGQIDPSRLEDYAESLLMQETVTPPDDVLLTRFAQLEIRSTPYALAADITGATTQTLISDDPRLDLGSREVLSDANWIRLQGICGT